MNGFLFERMLLYGFFEQGKASCCAIKFKSNLMLFPPIEPFCKFKIVSRAY